ncbi:MAG TPA: hypothetical protein VFG51_02865 [Candidatus Saccharimonadia bacterium]|nr:hypothetical protein [Candidatus Saccharimonadia bacterium]
MIPREIHDPEVLKLIAKEAEFMAKYTGKEIAPAYTALRVAAMRLRQSILGLNSKYECHYCGRQVTLDINGNYRWHYVLKSGEDKVNCRMSGKPVVLEYDPKEREAFRSKGETVEAMKKL